jgi:probable rRNA maturation factor
MCDPDVLFALEDDLRDLMSFAGEHEMSVPHGRWLVVVRLTGDDTIAELHARYFDDPEPTDVISFPSGADPLARTGVLGDIVISIDTAREQAADAGHSVDREVAFLALHGLLHLCGYDDESPDERDQMLDRQEQLLREFEARTGHPW